MPKKPLPQFVAPMQASSVKEPFESPDWIFETKLDASRTTLALGCLRNVLAQAIPFRAELSFFMGSNQRIGSLAMDILDQIVGSAETKEGKGMIVIHGRPSNNEGTACVFSLEAGTTVGYRRDDFAAALAELIRAGFIMELDQQAAQTRYKFVDK